MFEIQVLAWDRHKNVVGLNRLMGSKPFPLDNCSSSDNAYIIYAHNTSSTHIRVVLIALSIKQVVVAKPIAIIGTHYKLSHLCTNLVEIWLLNLFSALYFQSNLVTSTQKGILEI